MANVGNATLIITPKFDGLSQSIKNAMGDAAPAASQTLGQSIVQGTKSQISAASGAIIGVVSSLTSTAMSSISSHMGSAVSRIDTLKNYPQVMKTLGVSAKEAESSIQSMSDRLSNLPTRLDDMASTVQGLYAASEKYGVSLTTATDAGLALNNMLLAGGGSAQIVNSAMEQFRQMLSKGKPDMQDWKSLLSAAPGQMNQLAHSMLGAEASANDLYYALGGGKDSDEHLEGIQFASISVDQLLDSIIALDSQGGDGIASFADQAAEAQGGIGTAFSNMGNAVTRGLADVMDSFGRENIVAGINEIKSGIREAFSVIADAAKGLAPVIKTLWGSIKEIAPNVLTGVAAFVALEAVFVKLPAAFDAASKALMKNPIGIAVGLAAAAIGLIVPAVMDYVEAMEQTERASHSLSDTLGAFDGIKAAEGFDGYKSALSDVVLSYEDIIKSHNELADEISSRNAEAAGEIATWERVKSIIQEYGEAARELSDNELGELQYALSLLNGEMGTNYQYNADMKAIVDENGDAVEGLTEKIYAYIDAKKAEIEADAISANLKDIYAQRSKELAKQAELNQQITETDQLLGKAQLDLIAAQKGGDGVEIERLKGIVQDYEDRLRSLNGELANTEAALRDTEAAAKPYEQQLADVTQRQKEAEAAAESFNKSLSEYIAQSSVNDMFSGMEDYMAFVEHLESAGVAVRDFAFLTEEQQATIVDAWHDSSRLCVDELAYMTGNLALLGDEGARWMEGLASQTQMSSDEIARALASGIESGALSVGAGVDEMLAYLGEYNAAQVDEKKSRFSVDDGELVDAQGNVVVWNGTKLVYKETGVKVEQGELIYAQDGVYEWNGTDLKPLYTYVSVDTSGFGAAKQAYWDAKAILSQGIVSHVTTYKNTVITQTTHADGGFRTHADGGFRYHAGGSIVNAPVRGYPLDLVGEDGAEAIVPLTNRKYAQPFIDMLAKGVKEEAAQPVVNNYTIGKLQVPEDSALARAMESTFQEANRYMRMGKSGAGRMI